MFPPPDPMTIASRLVDCTGCNTCIDPPPQTKPRKVETCGFYHKKDNLNSVQEILNVISFEFNFALHRPREPHWYPKRGKRGARRNQTKKDKDQRFSPFERAAHCGSRGSPTYESGLYTGIPRYAFSEGGRTPGKDELRDVSVYNPDSTGCNLTVFSRTELSCSFEW